MDYKQKYEQALEYMCKVYPTLNGADKEDAEHYFPELKESEDERIRKALIQHIKYKVSVISGWRKEELIAWLEKQGEQKTDDKAEPKFKVGDWIINSEGMLRHIVDVDKTGYQTDNGWLAHDCYEREFHLWTIQDAKDGDVLTTKDAVFIFKHMDVSGLSLCKSHCDVIGNSGLGLGFDFPIQTVHPATEEQRDKLEKAITAAGYKWDAEKKELRKIEQNPAWDVEDEEMFDSIIADIQFTQKAHNHEVNQVVYEREIDWFKSLKNRVQLQSKQELSEADEPQKELAETYLAVFDEKFPILPTLKGKQLADYKNFLNKCQQILGLKYWSLRPLQAKLFEKLSLLWAAWGAEHLKGLGQTDGDTDNEKKEWSEEDEKIFDAIIADIQFTQKAHNHEVNQVVYEREIDWLKSLKERIKENKVCTL